MPKVSPLAHDDLSISKKFDVDLVVCMPAFNEAESILDYLTEINAQLKGLNSKLLVVDDCSTDGTSNVLSNAPSGLELIIFRNEKNLGHGPTTLIALLRSLELKPRLVCSTDGDGHFSGQTIRKLFDLMENSKYDIAEGVRRNRNEPRFRKATTIFSRFLLTKLSGVMVRDANTPLRIYRSEKLKWIISQIPSDSLTPNLKISMLSRISSLMIAQEECEWRPRMGINPQGTTWRSRVSFLPTRAFAWFCIKSTIDVLSFRKTCIAASKVFAGENSQL